MEIIIKISSGPKEHSRLLLRQTPNGLGRWGQVRFLVNEEVDECDWWVVLHSSGLRTAERTRCDPNHIVFVSMEPPYQKHSSAFLRQFSCIVSCDTGLNHPNVIYKNGLTWWAGIRVAFGSRGHEFDSSVLYNFEDFSTLRSPKKLDRVSVVTSTKQIWPGHAARLEFLHELLASPAGKYIDVFGGGHNPVADKMDALLPYKYHLALENGSFLNYWTEKIADPFLAWTLPFYAGCPNISDYFPRGSINLLDLQNVESASEQIVKAVESDLYSQSQQNLQIARNLVLRDYNIFNQLAELCVEPARTRQMIKLRPEGEQPFFRRAASALWRQISAKSRR